MVAEYFGVIPINRGTKETKRTDHSKEFDIGRAPILLGRRECLTKEDDGHRRREVSLLL